MNGLKPLLLLVDDNPMNIELLVYRLRKDYNLEVARNGPKALEYAKNCTPDLILLDILMPEMDGFAVCRELKACAQTRDIPIIFLSAMDQAENKTLGFELGAVDYITKPFHAAEVKARIQTHLTLKNLREESYLQNKLLEQKVREKTSEIQKMLIATVQSFSMAFEIRDPYTAGHQQRVAWLASAMAQKMGLSPDQINTVRFAGILHDIGKIRIPSSLLNRPGKLLPSEFDLIKIHPQMGYEILKNIPSIWPFARVILQHHERLDGSGYPEGLADRDILSEAKILAVADTMEAMNAHRPYRPALGLESAINEISTNRGRLYWPDAVDACLEITRQKDFKFEECRIE